MNIERKTRLFNGLKQNFFSATDLESYGNFKFEWEEVEYEDDVLEVDLIIKDHREREMVLRLRIYDEGQEGESEDLFDIARTEVNVYEDVWEEWNSFQSIPISELWRALFFQALED